MRRTDITEILENCLHRIEAGAPIESVVAEYPDQAGELRELLRIAASARPAGAASRIPASAQMESRRRMLERAKVLQGKRTAGGLWGVLRFMRAHLGTAALTAATIALLFIALSSINALPGDGLYPVKLAAERAGISLTNDEATRLEREAGFDMQRADEVAQMIHDRRSGPVNFGGFLKTTTTGVWQVAGVQLEIPGEMAQQAAERSEMFVEISGMLSNQGIVQVETLEPKLFALRGSIDSIGAEGWVINGQFVRVSAVTHISGSAQPGSQVTIQAVRTIGNDRLLALSAEVFEDPAAQETLTAKSTQTPAPSITPQSSQTPTVTHTPIPTYRATATPDSSDHNGGDDKEDDHENDTSDDHSNDEGGDHSDNDTDPPKEDGHSDD